MEEMLNSPQPLTEEEINFLWRELQFSEPFYSRVPKRWRDWAGHIHRRLDVVSPDEYWEWNAIAIMFVLATNDALDIPE